MSERPTADQARELLRRSFGHSEFRPGQARALESVLAGRDTLVILPTGGGKSLCFQVPALLLPGLTVVVSPLISLMKDQVDSLTARGLPAAFINSTLSAGQVSDRLARAERGEIRLLYMAPERFESGRLGERLRGMGVSLLAVDEAHCISEWGHDFRPSYLRLRDVRQALGGPPTVALTATATPDVRRDIVRELGLVTPAIVITGFDRRNLHYAVVRTRTERDKDHALLAALRAHEGSGVVYASTRRAVERITRLLESHRIRAAGYHAGLDDARRREVQDAFMGDTARVIVATNAFGMGIDKPNVRVVVHYAMPGTLEAYYQEAGRAGRDGRLSHCVMLHAFPDRFTHEYFIRSAHPERGVVERTWEALRRASGASGTPGLVALTAVELARLCGGTVKEREAESALRILLQHGALGAEPSSTTHIRVRLIATPQRIRRELGEGHELELGLLRALWRASGEQLYAGTLVDPDGLPPAFGGSLGIGAVLARLQERQFLTWEATGGGIRLAPSAPSLAAFRIDWPGIDRRRQADLARLDVVQHYAYTTGCRRGFVLRYFGDAEARRSCDGCDNCLRAGGRTRGAPRAR